MTIPKPILETLRLIVQFPGQADTVIFHDRASSEATRALHLGVLRKHLLVQPSRRSCLTATDKGVAFLKLNPNP